MLDLKKGIIGAGIHPVRWNSHRSLAAVGRHWDNARR